MYISRPKIDGGSAETGKQLSNKPTVALHQGKGNKTTLEVKDRGHELRHPLNKKFLSRGNALGLTDINDPSPDKDSQDKSDLPGNEY